MAHRMHVLFFLPLLCLSVLSCKPVSVKPTLEWSYTTSVDSIVGLKIDATTEGSYIIGGGYHNTYDMYSLKLDATGVKEWEHAYSNKTDDSNHTERWRHEANGIHPTSDGGYIIAGAGNNQDDGLSDAGFLLLKTDAAGAVAWSKTYAPENPYSPGYLCINCEPAAMQVTADNGYAVFGSVYVGQYNLASILKTDAEGNVQFNKVINDNARAYDEVIMGGQQTADGGYILAGYSENGAPHGYMALLIKLDENGDLSWSKTFQYTPDNHGAEAYAVTQTTDGGYVLGGQLVNDIEKASIYGFWMTKVDANGNQLWAHSYGDKDYLAYSNAIVETPQGDLVTVGRNHVGKMTLAKFSGTGVFQWNFFEDSLPNATGNDVVLMSDGSAVAVGSGSDGSIVMKVNNVFTVDEE